MRYLLGQESMPGPLKMQFRERILPTIKLIDLCVERFEACNLGSRLIFSLLISIDCDVCSKLIRQ